MSTLGLSPEQLANLEPHPFANVYPMIGRKAFEEMADSIANPEVGLLEPIVLFEGRILDGRNRYKALVDRKLELFEEYFRLFEGDEKAAIDYVKAKNSHRRHLGSGALLMAAAELLAMRNGKAVKPFETSGPPARGRGARPMLQGVREIAEQFGVPREELSRASITREKLTPSQIEWISNGDVSIAAAGILTRHHNRDGVWKFRTPETFNAEANRLRKLRPFGGHAAPRLCGSIFAAIDEISLRGVGEFIAKMAPGDADKLIAAHRNLQAVLDAIAATANPEASKGDASA